VELDFKGLLEELLLLFQAEELEVGGAGELEEHPAAGPADGPHPHAAGMTAV